VCSPHHATNRFQLRLLSIKVQLGEASPERSPDVSSSG
jgi:hypothetical protein